MYQVVNCGPSGHNIRCRASLKATPIGMMVMGNQANIVQEVSLNFKTFLRHNTSLMYVISMADSGQNM